MEYPMCFVMMTFPKLSLSCCEHVGNEHARVAVEQSCLRRCL